MIMSRQDRPDLAKALLKRRLVFTYALMVTEWGWRFTAWAWARSM